MTSDPFSRPQIPLIIPLLRAHFDQLEDRMRCFCKYGSQLEGWFKGELLFLLDSAIVSGEVVGCNREVRTAAGNVDLVVKTRDGRTNWIELKHWLIGRQGTYSYGASFYFGDPTSVGISRDVDKLRQLSAGGQRYMLILATANPGVEDWTRGVSKFNEKFAPLHVSPMTNPPDYPEWYFLGLLRVG